MEKETLEYKITKWKIEGTQYSFSDRDEAKKHFEETKKLLKSNETLIVTEIKSQTTDLDW